MVGIVGQKIVHGPDDLRSAQLGNRHDGEQDHHAAEGRQPAGLIDKAVGPMDVENVKALKHGLLVAVFVHIFALHAAI